MPQECETHDTQRPLQAVSGLMSHLHCNKKIKNKSASNPQWRFQPIDMAIFLNWKVQGRGVLSRTTRSPLSRMQCMKQIGAL
jgi:hypothetical protein